MFPGKKAGTQYSFGDPKGLAKEHEVTKPPRKSVRNCTIAEYSNIEQGEIYGERNIKGPHIHHVK